MNIAELTRIDRSIDIDASVERVWRALTDPAELALWIQVTIEGTFAPGHDVWMTSVDPQQSGQRFRVRVMEMTPPRRLVWIWDPGEIVDGVDYSREPKTTVTFTLEAAGSGTRLSVTEDGFDAISLERRAKVHADNSQGWNVVLALLQKHVEAAR